MPERIDILLPIRSTIRGRGGELERARKGLFPSLCRFGYPAVTDTVHIVCPAADLQEVTEGLLSFFPQFRFSVATDEQLAPEIGYEPAHFEKVTGWFRQQLIKLAVSARAGSEIVLVLDADVVAAKTILADDLQVWRLPYETGGMGIFRGWFETSAAALGLDLAALDQRDLDRAMGVTPEFLSREVVADLLDHLRQRAGGAAWGPYLMRFVMDHRNTWTEFSLYWLWYASKKNFRVTHLSSQIYKFIVDRSQIEPGLLGSTDFMFLVLQGTKLDPADCEPIYREMAADRPIDSSSWSGGRPPKIEILLVLGADFTGCSWDDLLRTPVMRSIERFCDPGFVERLVIAKAGSPLQGVPAGCDYRFPVICYEMESLLAQCAIPSALRRDAAWDMAALGFSRVCRTDFYLALSETALITNFVDEKLIIDGRMPRQGASAAAWSAGGDQDAWSHPTAGPRPPAFIAAQLARSVLERELAEAGRSQPMSGRPSEGGLSAPGLERYWSYVATSGHAATAYYVRKIYTAGDASDLDLRDHSRPELFHLRDERVAVPGQKSALNRLLVLSDDRGPADRGEEKGGKYEFIEEPVIRDLLLRDIVVWQVSFGGVGSNYLARLLGIRGHTPVYGRVCHFPYPVPLKKTDFRALYLFDDPIRAAISQLTSKHQINIAKNSNKNYSVRWCYGFDLAAYVARGEDLLNLARHFASWTSPRGPLGGISYPVLMLRFSAFSQKLHAVQKFLSFSNAQLNEIESKLVVKPRRSVSALGEDGPEVRGIIAMYSELAAKINAFPDAAIWDPHARVLRPV